MIYQLIDLPPRMIGFKAAWEITRKDFEEVVIPCVQRHVEKMGQSNYMLVLNNSIHNYSFCSWFKDVLLSLKSISRWKRAAIVTDSKVLKFFMELVGTFIPGELKGFSHAEFKKAVNWLNEDEAMDSHSYTKDSINYSK
jgi:hypothetical protein